jgi:predicted DNA-binding transcriptional regulator AlpA
MNIQKPEPLLDAREVKRLLRCSLPLVYKLANRGQIPCVKWECPGKSKRVKTMVRFKLEDVLSFIEKHYKST